MTNQLRCVRVLAVALVLAVGFVACSAQATLASKKSDGYIWYPASSVAQLKAQLNATDADYLLKVKPGAGDTVWLQLILDDVGSAGPSLRTMTDSNPPVDDSKRCPPACP